MTHQEENAYEMTLDPPGKIVVIGAGPLGIEAALYGRFLGYEVIVFEKGVVGQTLVSDEASPLPMLPDRCLSPLAVSALHAQDKGVISATDPRLPATIRQWVENGLQRIVATDLLVNRVQTQHEVIAIKLVAVELTDDTSEEEDDEVYIDGDVPPDFELTIAHPAGTRIEDAEAVIIATGRCPCFLVAAGETIESPYLFTLRATVEGTDEEALHRGWHQIVSIYAKLGGRANLDLYRPLRS